MALAVPCDSENKALVPGYRRGHAHRLSALDLLLVLPLHLIPFALGVALAASAQARAGRRIHASADDLVGIGIRRRRRGALRARRVGHRAGAPQHLRNLRVRSARIGIGDAAPSHQPRHGNQQNSELAHDHDSLRFLSCPGLGPFPATLNNSNPKSAEFESRFRSRFFALAKIAHPYVEKSPCKTHGNRRFNASTSPAPTFLSRRLNGAICVTGPRRPRDGHSSRPPAISATRESPARNRAAPGPEARAAAPASTHVRAPWSSVTGPRSRRSAPPVPQVRNARARAAASRRANPASRRNRP